MEPLVPVAQIVFPTLDGWCPVLAFLRHRAIRGVEWITEDEYRRTACLDGNTGFIAVHFGTVWQISCSPALLPSGGEIIRRVRGIFDLDADQPAIQTALARHGDWRVPGAWEPFEIAVRAILGQQVSVAAARTLAGRLAQAHGRQVASDAYLFPGPSALASADLSGIGLVRARAASIQALAEAVLTGELQLTPGRDLPTVTAELKALPGIGDWTAHYIAMRGLQHTDAFPAGDLILRRAAALGAAPLTTRALEAYAERWRPFRAYGAIALWREYTPP